LTIDLSGTLADPDAPTDDSAKTNEIVDSHEKQVP
jgi:hypothetical protein